MIKIEADSDGWWWWRKDGVLHREDGPAIYRQGMERWYYEGQLHNDNGPAVIIKYNNRDNSLIYLPNKKPYRIVKKWYNHGTFIKAEVEETNG